jgi:hypothetical protein
MFEKDIEKKILDFVRKSPIGVTSSEIAHYLGVSRITMTKYLAIFKEKALIDFKQFGMAKLWFIPVNLNKELFLKKITTYLASNLHKGDGRSSLNESGLELSKYIDKIYREQYKTEKLSLDQIMDSIIDMYKKVGGSFKVVERNKEKILLKCKKSPFDEDVSDSFILFEINAGIIGGLISKSTGYCKVCLKPAHGNGLYDVLVFLKKSKESEAEEGFEYYKD